MQICARDTRRDEALFVTMTQAQVRRRVSARHAASERAAHAGRRARLRSDMVNRGSTLMRRAAK